MVTCVLQWGPVGAASFDCMHALKQPRRWTDIRPNRKHDHDRLVLMEVLTFTHRR
jgi:hypothetical protein